jgi:hypothetical protein
MLFQSAHNVRVLLFGPGLRVLNLYQYIQLLLIIHSIYSIYKAICVCVEGVHRARGLACACKARLRPCFRAPSLPCCICTPYCPTPPAPARVPALPRVYAKGVHEASGLRVRARVDKIVRVGVEAVRMGVGIPRACA